MTACVHDICIYKKDKNVMQMTACISEFISNVIESNEDMEMIVCVCEILSKIKEDRQINIIPSLNEDIVKQANTIYKQEKKERLESHNISEIFSLKIFENCVKK